MIRLARGTKEEVAVEVTDHSSQITDLSGQSPTFTVEEDDGTPVVTGQSTSAIGMTIYPSLDTTGWSTGTNLFKLWVSFTIGSEVPVLGPFDILLS